MAPPAERLHVLADGTSILVRPLRPDDRDELRARYTELSPRSRRLRFVSAPEHLSARFLDHLLDVDFVDRYALVATLVDEPDRPSVGIARFARRRGEPTAAEAAVTVLDAHHGRGIGTLLLADLVADALAAGITTFVADVMWENVALLDGLRSLGAAVTPGEPGLAAVSVDLPPTLEAFERATVRQVLRTVGADLTAGLDQEW